MKKILLASVIGLGVMFNGCVGIVTKHEYTPQDMLSAKIMYQVVRNGVDTFMTQEQIEAARLDKVNVFLTGTYKLVEGNAAN